MKISKLYFFLDKIHKWIEIKPLIEAVNWTLQEKFYLVAAVTSYKSDW